MPRKKRGGDARKAPPVLLAAVLGAAAAIAAVRLRRGTVSNVAPVTPGRVAVPRLRLQLRLLWDGLERELVNLFGNRAGFMHERMAIGEVEQDARAGIGTMDARQAWGALVAHATKWKEWSDGSDDRPEEGLVAVYLTAGRGLIPRRGDWLPGTAWDMSDLAPLSVAERCEPAPEDATFTHVCG